MPFQPPIGTEAERNSGKVWPGTWEDATPYMRFYFGKWYHTGADLNNNKPRWDADAHAEVYAIGDGVVTYAQLVSTTVWGNLIVIDHGVVDGKPLFSRYAHVEAINVTKGQTVKMGQMISRVGNAEGLFAYHLHFDISTTEILRTRAGYWPGADKQGVKAHFVDPLLWLQQHQTAIGELNTTGTTDISTNNLPPRTPAKPIWHVIAPNGLDVYDNSLTTATKSDKLARGTKIMLNESGRKGEGFIWVQIAEGNFKDKWIQKSKADQSENYISTNPPTTTTVPDNKPTPAKPIWHVIAPNGLDVYDNSLTTATKSGKLARAAKIMLNESGRKGEGFIWVQIAEGNFKDKWIQKSKADPSETYITTNPPQN